MIVVMILLGRCEDWRIEMPAMARPAAHRHTRVLDHTHVVLIDVFDHPVHQSCGVLLRLRVVGKIQPRLSVRTDVVGIGGMARAALSTKCGFPLVHQIVDLLSRHGLRKDLQVGWRRFLVMMMFLGRRLLRCGGLGESGNGKQCGDQRRQRGGERRGRELQVQSSSWCGMTSILLTDHRCVWLTFLPAASARKRNRVRARQTAAASPPHA